ncbi:hypothetical protein Npun_R1247 [Nostoc punctiforme PCC 73102]|uniref:Uncharacterized protein n=1 Tax=Nostoc punctiforme (strain ATCC 29133 / PCC 73102) TaxID=63737 RepID=B2IXE8_NOSP7|nr:hypothetical protein Npun_R1247 [Nostoc punctiforme PCC 73102]
MLGRITPLNPPLERGETRNPVPSPWKGGLGWGKTLVNQLFQTSMYTVALFLGWASSGLKSNQADKSIRPQHELIRSEHEPICSEHEPIRSEHEPIRSEHEPIRSEHEPIRSEHELICSEHELIRSKHKPIVV